MSSVSASSSSAWLLRDAFARSPRMRLTQSPSSTAAKCSGCAQLTMKYSGRSRSVRSIASPSGSPLGSRPSVSTVNETIAGTPAARAARTIPIASSA